MDVPPDGLIEIGAATGGGSASYAPGIRVEGDRLELHVEFESRADFRTAGSILAYPAGLSLLGHFVVLLALGGVSAGFEEVTGVSGASPASVLPDWFFGTMLGSAALLVASLPFALFQDHVGVRAITPADTSVIDPPND